MTADDKYAPTAILRWWKTDVLTSYKTLQQWWQRIGSPSEGEWRDVPFEYESRLPKDEPDLDDVIAEARHDG